MKAYIGVRTQCEESLRASGLNATIVRPWYVVGPGHRWPVVLKPLYRAAELVPALRQGARRLGLVNLKEMIRTLALAIESPAEGIRIVEVPEIRRLGVAGEECRTGASGAAQGSRPTKSSQAESAASR